MYIWAEWIKTRTRVMQVTLVFSVLVIVVSCSSSSRQLFFDIQPPTAEEQAEKARQEALLSKQALESVEAQETDSKSLAFGIDLDNQPRPAIEDTLDWEKALEMLPKDYKKKADWSAAIKEGVVRPRTGSDPYSGYAASFQWDFIMEAEKPKNEAYFPHSAHTQWLGCKNCHTSIYPYRRNPATMKEMKKGASCGTCHGKNNVAFSLKQCKRCHLNR